MSKVETASLLLAITAALAVSCKSRDYNESKQKSFKAKNEGNGKGLEHKLSDFQIFSLEAQVSDVATRKPMTLQCHYKVFYTMKPAEEEIAHLKGKYSEKDFNAFLTPDRRFIDPTKARAITPNWVNKDALAEKIDADAGVDARNAAIKAPAVGGVVVLMPFYSLVLTGVTGVVAAVRGIGAGLRGENPKWAIIDTMDMYKLGFALPASIVAMFADDFKEASERRATVKMVNAKKEIVGFGSLKEVNYETTMKFEELVGKHGSHPDVSQGKDYPCPQGEDIVFHLAADQVPAAQSSAK